MNVNLDRLLLAKIRKLQRALFFWLPDIPPDDPYVGERIAADTMLLIGMNGEGPDETAQRLGWIHLRPVSHRPITPEGTAEIQRLAKLTNADLARECAGSKTLAALNETDSLLLLEMIERIRPGWAREHP